MNGFFFGLGYSARAAIDELRADRPEAHRFAGTTRS